MSKRTNSTVQSITEWYKSNQKMEEKHRMEIIEYGIDSRQYFTTFAEKKGILFYTDCLIILSQMIDGQIFLGYAIETDGFPLVERRIPRYKQTVLLNEVLSINYGKTQLQIAFRRERTKEVWKFRFRNKQILNNWRKLLQGHINKRNSLYSLFGSQNQQKVWEEYEKQKTKTTSFQYEKSDIGIQLESNIDKEINTKVMNQQLINQVISDVDQLTKIDLSSKKQIQSQKLQEELILSRKRCYQLEKQLQNLKIQKNVWYQKQQQRLFQESQKQLKMRELLIQNNLFKVQLANKEKQMEQFKNKSFTSLIGDPSDRILPQDQLIKQSAISESTKRSLNSQIIVQDLQNSNQMFKRNLVFADISQIRNSFRKMSYQQMERDSTDLREELNIYQEKIQFFLKNQEINKQYLYKLQKQHQKVVRVLQQRIITVQNERNKLITQLEDVSKEYSQIIKGLSKQNNQLKQSIIVQENTKRLLLNSLIKKLQLIREMQERRDLMEQQNYQLKFKRLLLESTLNKYSIRNSLIL